MSGFAGVTIVVFVFAFAKVGVVLDTANITDTAIAEKMRYLNSVLLDRGTKANAIYNAHALYMALLLVYL